ncbi:hypothetical protein [Agromyces sp. NPDC058126]
MNAQPIDPAAISLPPTQPIDMTDYLPDPSNEPTSLTGPHHGQLAWIPE